MNNHHLTLVEETIDCVEGPTSFQLEKPTKTPDALKLAQKERFISCRFEVTPYLPFFKGRLVRNGMELGDVAIIKEHVQDNKIEFLESGLIKSIRCLDEENNVLAEWNFHTLPTHITQLVLYEKNPAQDNNWTMKIDPFGYTAVNRVFLIPLGAIWKNREKLDTLTQVYGYLRTNRSQQAVWNLLTDADFMAYGIPMPKGGLIPPSNQWFAPISADYPTRPRCQDIKSTVTIDDAPHFLRGTLIENIHPVSLQATLLFKEKTHVI